jgi:RNA polymerase sigma factor (sigma-70 family)
MEGRGAASGTEAEIPSRRPSLDDLVVQTRPLVEGYVAKRVSNRDHRDEIVSRIYAALARSWDSFRGDCAPSGYVLKIAGNAIANYYERDLARERRQISLDGWVEEFYVQHSTGSPGPQEQVHDRDEIAGLLAEMRRVCSPEQCAVVELVYQGNTMDQIGTLLDMQAATVRSHFLRGRARLLAHLLVEAPEYLGGVGAVEAAIRKMEMGSNDGLSGEEAEAIRQRKGPAEVLRKAMLKVAPYLGAVLGLGALLGLAIGGCG